MKLVVGLTGGIASGKSYVSSYLINLGYKVIDTDKITKTLYSNPSFIADLKENFKECFINDTLDRNLFKSILFSDKTKLETLNKLAHPRIYEETLREINESSGIIFIDAPLLFEASFDKLCDLVVCVYTKKEEQIKRLMSRDNVDINFANKIINSQMDVEIKKNKSDILIESCIDYNDTNKNIIKMLERIKDYGKNLRD